MRLLHCLLMAALIWAAPLAALADDIAPPKERPAGSAEAERFQEVTARPALRTVTVNGFTRARASLPLMAEVAGRCLSVAAEVGEPLGADGVFCRLDDTFVKLDLEANALEQKRADSSVAYLEKEATRYRALVNRKSEAQSRLDKLEDELTRTRLNLASLKTAAAILRERLARHTIKGPPGWRVTKRLVEPGQWVGSGKQVGEVANFNILLVPLALTPDEYAHLQEQNGKLMVRLPDLNRVVPARIERVNPAFDPATRKIELDLALEQDLGPGEKRGGWRVELDIETPDPTGAVLLPKAAVAERYQESWLTLPDGRRIRAVVLGPGPGDTLRVQSPEVKAGMTFLAPR